MVQRSSRSTYILLILPLMVRLKQYHVHVQLTSCLLTMCEGETDHEVGEYGPVTFLVDDIIQCVNINITDDKIEEDIELFQISFYYRYNCDYCYNIRALHGNPRVVPLSRATITIYIYMMMIVSQMSVTIICMIYIYIYIYIQ